MMQTQNPTETGYSRMEKKQFEHWTWGMRKKSSITFDLKTKGTSRDASVCEVPDTQAMRLITRPT